jgi:uncharacterized protein with FMN-binding domain
MMNKVFLVMVLLITIMLFACSSTAENAHPLYRSGTYEGNGDGYFGLITVALTVTENALAEVEVISHCDTEGIGTIAFEELSQTMVYSNSPDVDVIAGATGSSEGFISAVNDALSQARAE